MKHHDLELLASLSADIPNIDLHACTSAVDALTTLDQSLTHFSRDSHTACRVIYGIGTGKMRQAVLQELHKHPMVRGVVEEASGGSAIVGL